jgi:hypothetical protein
MSRPSDSGKRGYRETLDADPVRAVMLSVRLIEAAPPRLKTE